MIQSEATLASIATAKGLVGGPFGSSLVKSDYEPEGIPVIRGANLNAGGMLGGEFAFVSEGKFQRDLTRNAAIPGDLVFTQRGTLGQLAIVPDDPFDKYVVSQSQMRLRIDKSIADPRYVYFACGSDPFLRQINDNAIATGVPHINLGILGRLTIPLPTLPEQQAIAEVLGALDDKIATNTKAARTFKELAQAEFQQLLATATTQVPLREVLHLEYGKSLAATRRVHGEVDVFGSGGIVGTHNESLLPGPGVIVGRKGTAGSVHWAPREYFPIDTTFYAVPVNQNASLVFCLHLLKSLRLNEMNSDSAVPGLNREEALAALVPMPFGSKMRLFTTSAERLFALVDQADRESRTLTQIRDALLPKLMSGKLSVTEVETAVSAAV